MAAYKSSSLVVSLFLFFTVIAPTIRANIAEFDDYWRQREAEAKIAALEAYHPIPEDVNNHFNLLVEELLIEINATRSNLRINGTRSNLSINGTRSNLSINGTRRNLRANKGPCKATNPIDRCWRCRPKWAAERKRLADCALGFGRHTVGGKYGSYYFVTDSSDDDMVNPKKGTLRHAVIQPGPLWIMFSRSMTIRLNQELIMTGDKTIDGRGVNVHIAYGAGITIQYIKNVIIHGLHFHHIVSGSGGLIRDSVTHFGIRGRSDGDAISIFGSSNIWIDHNSLSNCKDGLIDAIEGSTGITISNNHFSKHNEVMLFGASDGNSEDAIMQITVAFNKFGKGLNQRMPRCRWGFFHVVNNVYTNWHTYAIGGSAHPTIISQGNRYTAPRANPKHDAKQVTKRDYATESEWRKWTWRSEGDQMRNGAYFVQSGKPSKRIPYSRLDMIKAMPGHYAPILTRFAGALTCRLGRPC